jgi:hypothetical protein
MAFGLDTEMITASDREDDRFIKEVARIVGRALTAAEEGTAFDVRDQGGYNAREAAAEILA